MRQFSRTGPNSYACSDGFEVEVLGRTGLNYRERDRSMFIDSEVLVAPAGILVYQDSIGHWQPPHDHFASDTAERNRIVSNVVELLESQGIAVQVI